MTTRPLRRWLSTLAGLGAGALLLAGPLSAAAAPHAPAKPMAESGAAVASLQAAALASLSPMQSAPGRENLMACFQSSREARLLLLMDESGSLRTADPDGGRILAAEYAINDLSRRASQKDATFQVAVRGFADGFEENETWLTLPADRQKAVDLVRSFADRNRGGGTDYWMALNGARAALANADPSGAECQAMIWFSDGELDPTPTFEAEGATLVKPYLGTRTDATREQAAEAAEADLCRAGGVADQVRSAGITTFGVALGAGGATRDDFATMEAVTVGTAEGGTNCGSRIDPQPGEFFFTGGSDGLLSAFDSIFALDEIQTDYPPTDICQGDVSGCDGTVFVLDSSIQHVHIFATSDVGTPEVSLVPPNGDPVSVPWGKDNETTELAAGGGDLTVTGLTDNSIALDMSATGDEPWTGAWAIKFVDPAAASAGQQVRARISISGGLLPVATILGDGGEADTVRRGDEASITLGIRDRDGGEVAPESLLGSVQMDVGLVTSDGVVIPVQDNVGKEEIGTPLSVDLSDAEVGDSQVRLKLRVVTASTTVGETTIEGTALAEAVNNIPFRLLLAADYPVAASVVDLGATEEQTTLPGILSVTGPGCVWVDPGTLEFTALPGDVGTPRFTSEHSSAATCLTVGGAEGELPIELDLDDTGNGGIAGTFTAFVAPEGEPTRAEAVPVRLMGSIERAANPVTKWALFAGVLAAGILIPLGLLYFAKWRGSTIPARALFYEEIPVDVTDDRVLRQGAEFGYESGDLRSMVPIPPKGGRSLSIGEATLKASAGVSPLGAGSTLVSVPGAQVITSADTAPDKQGRGQLPLAIHNSWSAWISPAGTKVLLLVGADATDGIRRELYADVADRLPRAFANLDASVKPSSDMARVTTGASAGSAAVLGSATGDEWSDFGDPGDAASSAGTTASAASPDDWGGWGDEEPHASVSPGTRGTPAAPEGFDGEAYTDSAEDPGPATAHAPDVPVDPPQAAASSSSEPAQGDSAAPSASSTPESRPGLPVAPEDDWGAWDDD